MSHRARPVVPAGVRRALFVVAALLFAATVTGMVLLWRGDGRFEQTADLRLVAEVHDAVVVETREEPCPGTDPTQEITCPVLDAELVEGPDRGDIVEVPLPTAFAETGLERGDRVVLGVQPDAPEDMKYALLDRDREPVLFWLAAGFALAVIVLGGIRGMAALAGLGASLGVLLTFVLPSILGGKPPVWVAIVGASAIAFLAIYLAHGVTPMSTVALLGTLGSLALTAGLATLFLEIAHITGLASEEAALLNLGAATIDLEGLILAGVVLGALGAIDDMTVTQASAMWELREASPAMSNRLLFRAGMRIGRDHVASTVNTLALAYAGASMPLLILLVLSEQSLGAVANSEVVATEIVRTLVGSIGLVAAVPLTTWLASRAVPRRSDLDPAGRAGDAEVATEAAAVPAPPPEPERSIEDEFWNRRD